MTVNFEKLQAAPAPVSLEKYIELVDRCARERLNHPIANGSPVHARILIAKLFETAQSDIRLVSGTLRQSTRDRVDIYAHPPVIEQAMRYLRQPNSKLSIVVQTGEPDGGDKNVFLTTVANDKERQGELTVCIPKPGVLDQSVAHFMVADSATYRVETGEDAKPSNTAIAAIANFGDGKTAKSLADYFSDIEKYLRLDDHLLKRVCLKPGEPLSFYA